MDLSHSRHYFFLGLLIIVFALNFWVFLPFVGAFIFAATFSVLFKPWYNFIFKYMKGYPSLAAIFTMLAVFLAIIIPLLAFGSLVFSESQILYAKLASEDSPELLGKISENLRNYFPVLGDVKSVFSVFGEYAKSAAEYLVTHLGGFFSRAASLALNIFITFLAFYFFLRDGERFRALVVQLSPLSDSDDYLIMTQLEKVVNSVIKGALLVALIQGVMAGVGYLIFGVPNPALWGAMTAITALVPGIGTAVVIAPASLYLFLVGQSGAGIGLLIWGFVIVGLADNLIKPKFIAAEVGIHPFLILLSVVGGLITFGVYGFLLAPLLLSFLFALIDLYKRGVAPHAH